MSEMAAIAIAIGFAIALIAVVGLCAGALFALRLRQVVRQKNAMIENAFGRSARSMLDLRAGQGLIRSDAKALKCAVKKAIDQALLVQAELGLANENVAGLARSLLELQAAQADRFETLDQRIRTLALTAQGGRAGIKAVEDLAVRGFEDLSARGVRNEAAIARLSEALAQQHEQSRESFEVHGAGLSKLSSAISDQHEELSKAHGAISDGLTKVAKSQSSEFGVMGSRIDGLEKSLVDRRALESLLDQETRRTTDLSNRLDALEVAGEDVRDQLERAEEVRETAEQRAGRATSDFTRLQIDIEGLRTKLKSSEPQSERLREEIEDGERWQLMLATDYMILIKSAKDEAWGSTLAQALLCRGESQRARLEMVLEEKPNEPLIHYAMARHLINSGKFEAALPYLRNTLRLGIGGDIAFKNLFRWLTMSADLLVGSARPDLAVEALTEWIGLEQIDIGLRVKAGLKASGIMELTGRRDEALECLSSLVSAAPDHTALRRKRALYLHRVGRYEDAVGDFELLHSAEDVADPDHVRSLFALGREEEAAKLARAIPNPPHDVKAIADRLRLMLRTRSVTKIVRTKRSLEQRFDVAEGFRRTGRPFRDVVRAYADLNQEADAYCKLGLVENAAAVPSVFLFGPPRSGTTLLRRCLGLNAAMNVRPSEPEFLSNNRFMPLADYLVPFQRQITKAHESRIRLSVEKSPQMFALEDDWTKVFAAMFPDARLVVTVRDPVSRAWSFVKHLDRDNMSRALVDTDAEDFPAWMKRTVEDGLYERHLEKWISALGPDRIFLMDFEILSQDPQAAVASACEWLDCRLDYMEEDIASLAAKWHNRTPPVAMPDRLEGFLRSCYSGQESDPALLRKRLGVGGV